MEIVLAVGVVLVLVLGFLFVLGRLCGMFLQECLEMQGRAMSETVARLLGPPTPQVQPEDLEQTEMFTPWDGWKIEEPPQAG